MLTSSMLVSLVTLFSILAPTVKGHARVNSPPIRSPGPAFQKQCGSPSFQSVSSDPTGHIEEQEPFNAGCQPTLCRGMPFSDQPASNVQKVVAGQAMAMGIDCTIPHGGPANVSLVDTTVGGAGQRIGSFLATFDDFCPTSGSTPADQSNLQFSLPSANVIGNKCQTPGDCVVQLFWATPDFSQNYYYCVDVQVNAASVPATTSAPPQTTSLAPPTTSATPTTSTAPTTSPALTTSTVSQTTAPSSSTSSTVELLTTTASSSISEDPVVQPTDIVPSVVTSATPEAPLSMVTITTIIPPPSPTSPPTTTTPIGGSVNGALAGAASSRYSVKGMQTLLVIGIPAVALLLGAVTL